MKIRNFKLKKRKGNIFPIFLFIIVTIFGMLLLLQNTSNRRLTINQKGRFQATYIAQAGLDMMLEASQRYPVEVYKAALKGTVGTGGELTYEMPKTGAAWATLLTPNASTANVDIKLVSHLDSMGNIAEMEVVSTALYGDTTAVKTMRMYVVDKTLTAIYSPFGNDNGVANDYFTKVLNSTVDPDKAVGSSTYPHVKGRYSTVKYNTDTTTPNLVDDQGKKIIFSNAISLNKLTQTFTQTATGDHMGPENIWVKDAAVPFSIEIINESESSELRSEGNTFIGIDNGNSATSEVTIKDSIKVTGKKDTNIVVDAKTLVLDGLTTPEILPNETKRKGIITTTAENVIIQNIPLARNNTENIFDYYVYAPYAKVTIQKSDGATFAGSIVAKQLVVYDNDNNLMYDSSSSTYDGQKVTAIRNILFSDKNYSGDFYTEIGKKYVTIPLTTSIHNYDFIFVEYKQ